MNNIINGIFLLFLVLCGNFTGEILGCSVQNLLTNNRYVKYLVTFFLIFITINFSNDENINPTKIFLDSLLVFVGYILFSRMNLRFTFITTLTLVLIYILNLYEDYYNKKEPNNKFLEEYKKYKKYLYYLVAILIIIGFLSYLFEKKKEYGNKFNVLTYVFGVTKCKSLR